MPVSSSLLMVLFSPLGLPQSKAACLDRTPVLQMARDCVDVGCMQRVCNGRGWQHEGWQPQTESCSAAWIRQPLDPTAAEVWRMFNRRNLPCPWSACGILSGFVSSTLHPRPQLGVLAAPSRVALWLFIPCTSTREMWACFSPCSPFPSS